MATDDSIDPQAPRTSQGNKIVSKNLSAQLKASQERVSELQAANERLLRNQAKTQHSLVHVQAAFDAATQPILVVNNDLKLVRANRRALNLFGKAEPLVLGSLLDQQQTAQATILAGVVSVIRFGSGAVEEHSLFGKKMLLTFKPEGPTDEPDFVVIYLQETSAQEFDLFQKTALKGIGLLLLDAACVVRRSNGTMESLLGWQRHQANGIRFARLFHQDDRDLVQSFIDEKQPQSEESLDARLASSAGQVHWVRLIQQWFHHNALIFVQNITQEKQLTVQLQQAHKMEAIGKLTSGIAHDFNNILTALMGNLELMSLADPAMPVATVTNYVNRATDSAERAKKLIAQMLMFSQRGDGNRHTEHINPIVGGVLGMLNTLFTPATRLSYQEQGPTFAQVDRVQLEQVIMNLCINSRDALADSGDIVVRVEQPATVNEHCSSCHQPIKGSYICISVADSGRGISQADLERIFDPFYTTKNVGEGTGMGLSVVHGLVHEQDGHVTVESSPGDGAVFTLYLPAVQVQDVGALFDSTIGELDIS